MKKSEKEENYPLVDIRALPLVREFEGQVLLCPFVQSGDPRCLLINCSSCPQHPRAKIKNKFIREALKMTSRYNANMIHRVGFT